MNIYISQAVVISLLYFVMRLIAIKSLSAACSTMGPVNINNKGGFMQTAKFIASIDPIPGDAFLLACVPKLELVERKDYGKGRQYKSAALSTEEEAICDMATD
jgi:hypothetical protein